MGEKRVDVKIFTLVFLVVLIGFLSFLVYQGCRDVNYKERLAPKENIKKN